MNNELKAKYNLLTAIAAVVGIVVGVGIFFKSSSILSANNGNLTLSIISWLIGGAIMIICALNFAFIATRKDNIRSLSDFASSTVSKKYAYYVTFFFKIIYFPAMTGVVGFISGLYTLQLFGVDFSNAQYLPYIVGFIYIILIYLVNIFAPIVAGKLQVSTTIIKLIPLLIMGIVGLFYGLFGPNHILIENFKAGDVLPNGTSTGFLAATAITAFAYEGWISATNITGELKNPRRNLPIALIIGSILVIGIYLLYNLGISGSLQTIDLITGNKQVQDAYAIILGGKIAGSVLFVFVIISALGALNGLTMANSRQSYFLAREGMGIAPKFFSKLSGKKEMPIRASLLGLLLAIVWLVYFYFSYTSKVVSPAGAFPFDASELPVLTTYIFYIPIFISVMIKDKEIGVIKRFIVPVLGVLASLFMIFAAVYRHQITTLWYMILFGVVMFVAFILDKINTSRSLLD